MTTRTKVTSFVVVCIMFLCIAPAVQAQTGPGIFANVDFLAPKINPFGKVPSGTSTDIGYIYQINQESQPTRLGANIFATSKSDPLIVSYPEKMIYKARAGWIAGNRNGFLVSGLMGGYKNEGSLNRTVSTAPQTQLTRNVVGVAEFDTAVPVAINPLYASGRSPVNVAAKTALDLQHWDVRYVRTLYCSEDCSASASVSGGLAKTTVVSKRTEGQKQRGFLPNPDRSPNGIIDDITILQESESNFSGYGPVVGFDFRVGFAGVLAFYASASQAFPSAELDQEGMWGVQERGTLGLLSPAGGGAVTLTQGPELFTSRTMVPLKDTPGRVTVPVTDLQLSLRVQLAGPCLEIGPTLTLTRFANMPVAPSLVLSETASTVGSYWKNNTTDMSIAAVAISVGFRF